MGLAAVLQQVLHHVVCVLVFRQVVNGLDDLRRLRVVDLTVVAVGQHSLGSGNTTMQCKIVNIIPSSLADRNQLIDDDDGPDEKPT